mmetsp:Transcript_25489/g.58796  ORF Transcript_25489/g.58796 Transcript_25489/m.58796 type:complete len:398 (-) Transcript_25489:113-1306(-)
MVSSQTSERDAERPRLTVLDLLNAQMPPKGKSSRRIRWDSSFVDDSTSVTEQGVHLEDQSPTDLVGELSEPTQTIQKSDQSPVPSPSRSPHPSHPSQSPPSRSPLRSRTGSPSTNEHPSLAIPSPSSKGSVLPQTDDRTEGFPLSPLEHMLMHRSPAPQTTSPKFSESPRLHQWQLQMAEHKSVRRADSMEVHRRRSQSNSLNTTAAFVPKLGELPPPAEDAPKTYPRAGIFPRHVKGVITKNQMLERLQLSKSSPSPNPSVHFFAQRNYKVKEWLDHRRVLEKRSVYEQHHVERGLERLQLTEYCLEQHRERLRQREAVKSEKRRQKEQKRLMMHEQLEARAMSRKELLCAKIRGDAARVGKIEQLKEREYLVRQRLEYEARLVASGLLSLKPHLI